MKNNLLEILKAVTVSSKDNGKCWTDITRLSIIKQLLCKTEYKILNSGEDQDLYVLFGKEQLSKTEKYIVISTHIDAVMNHFFVEQKQSELIGTFDNAITNAAVIYNMLEGNFDDNILIAFTGNEENGMRGAANLYKYLSNYDIIVYMVLDVTWDDYYKNIFTLENISLPDKIFNKLIDLANSTDEKYLLIEPYKFDDETAVYSNHACFSFCIPIDNDKNMHSKKGVKTTIELFERYTQALPIIANGI